ncbi:MAG: DnaA/Hda family protein [Pseudomonadota bacterium]
MATDTQAPESSQLLLGFPANNEQTLEQFVCSDTLRAYTQALASGDSDDWVLADGGPGQGKSHWLMALCHRAGPRAGYVSGTALAAAGPTTLEQLTGLELICIDDLHLLLTDPDAGRAWQEAWFHQINRWRAEGTQLVVTSEQAAAALGLTLPDLVSRLAAMTRIQLPTLGSEQQRQLLALRAKARGIRLPEPLLDYLLSRHTRSAPELVSLLDQLAEASLKAQRKLTVPFARQVLGAPEAPQG